MLRRTIELGRFLRSVQGTEVLREYCAQRGIDFIPHAEGGETDVEHWQHAVARLSPARQADFELEVAQVQELSNRESIYHLIDACAEQGLPADLIVGEVAQALWFLVHQPGIFQEVYFSEATLESQSWQNAQATPGIHVPSDGGRRTAFERELKHFFQIQESNGRFVASQSYAFEDPARVVFVGYIADRPRFVDGFTDDGEHRPQRVRPSVSVTFAYYPADGTVLLKPRHRAREKVLALLQLFARSVLQAEIDERSLGTRFHLDRLAEPFSPSLPEGIAMARVKSLDLAYPASEGRRRLRLETHITDRPSAVLELLRRHVDEESRARLRVVSAELQVALRVRGRVKNHVIRLWPNRCSLSQTQTSEFLRRCLTTWGLITHAPEP